MAAPIDAVIKGMALNDMGFTAENTVEGLGLNTFGFLWPCDGIWQPTDTALTTTWIGCGGATIPIEVCDD